MIPFAVFVVACSTPLPGGGNDSTTDGSASFDATLPPMPAPGSVGAPCQVDSDCHTGQCVTDGYPGGYCRILGCDPNQAPCPVGSSCIILQDRRTGLNFTGCMEACSTASDCRAGYSCCKRPSLMESWCDQASSQPLVTCTPNP